MRDAEAPVGWAAVDTGGATVLPLVLAVVLVVVVVVGGAALEIAQNFCELDILLFVY